MLRTEEYGVETGSSGNQEDVESMYKKAGLLLEKLALETDHNEESPIHISKYLTEGMFGGINQEEEQRNDEDPLEKILKEKQQELDMMLKSKKRNDSGDYIDRILGDKKDELESSLDVMLKNIEEQNGSAKGNDENETPKNEDEFYASIDTMLKTKEDELEAIKLDAEDLFETFLTDDEKQKSPRQEIAKEKEEEPSVDSEETTIENTEKQDGPLEETDEIIAENEELDKQETQEVPDDEKFELDNSESVEKLEATESQAEIALDKLAFDYEEEKINDMLKTVESRQDMLQKKMLTLQATSEALKEQLMGERLKWKQEIREIIDMQKKGKGGNGVKYQSGDAQKKTDVCPEYSQYAASAMNLERELKKRNYQNWLSEIADECNKELTKVQSSLTVLKPLKDMISRWNRKDEEESNQLSWDTILPSNKEEIDLIDSTMENKINLEINENEDENKEETEVNNDYKEEDNSLTREEEVFNDNDENEKETENELENKEDDYCYKEKNDIKNEIIKAQNNENEDIGPVKKEKEIDKDEELERILSKYAQ